MSAANDTTDGNLLTGGMPRDDVEEAVMSLLRVQALLHFTFDHTGALASHACERDERDRVNLLLGIAKEKVAAVLESMNRYV